MTTTHTQESSADAPELDVSVIMPCLNEEASVTGCVRAALAGIEAMGVRGEVIVIDNGSTDRSAALAAAAGARVISEPRRGKGYAVQRGIAESRGRYVVLTDGDGTYDLSQLAPMVEPLRRGYDMVTGNRLKGQIAPGAMPWVHRRIGNPMFGALISLITGQRFGDCLSGLRAFRRDVWETMSPRSAGFELESEMCLMAGRHKLRVTDIPIPYAARLSPSKLRGLSHGWAIARFIILESADLIFLAPAFLALVLGAVSLALGVTVTSGVDVGSFRWQPVFAGGILVPGGIAFISAGLAAKWLAWRRGITAAGRLVHMINDPSSRLLEAFLGLGFFAVLAGTGLDAYLLVNWANDTAVDHALGLGAVAQTLMVSGLNLIVTAVLIGVLRAGSEPEAPSAAADSR